MQVELIFVRFGVVENLHVAALHAHSEPLSSGTVAQRKDLHTTAAVSDNLKPSSASPEAPRSAIPVR